MAEEKVPAVYAAINAVQADLAKVGIGKDQYNSAQKYKFRGIDQVYNALSPLLAKHSLCILPRILKREVSEREGRNGGAVFYVSVEAEFDFVCATDGSRHVVRTFGEAMDFGDKATNKAMSAAYKYAAFQAFAIPTEGDNDADATSHEVKKANVIKPRGDDPLGALPADQRGYIVDLADQVRDLVAQKRPTDAVRVLADEHLEADQKIALWDQLDAHTRSALKTAEKAPQLQTEPA